MEIDSGNTAWMLASAALVGFMTPGLALFYGGLTRNKNVLSTIMQSFMSMGVVGVLWVIIGYSLAFGPDVGGGIIGDLSFFGLKGVGPEPGGVSDEHLYGANVPHLAFMAFQGMFAIITPALITGAFAERVRFGPYLIFIALWSLIVYAPVAHWVFAYDGWLNHFSTGASEDIGLNGLDFAGGLAIHINAGIAALAAVLVFGRRKGYGTQPMEPHDVTMVVLGAAILWFGWFGFNGGSAGAANGQAAVAFVNTNVAAAAGALTWVIIAWQVTGKASAVAAASGAVAGLVAVTPASGYVQAMEALGIGVVAGGLCYGAVILRAKLKFDDSLDVIPVHGVGGLWGTIATGLFATAAVGAPGFREGLFTGGDFELLRDQLIGTGAVIVYSFVVTYALLKAIDLVVGVRVSDDEEELGLDLSQHGERAYTFEEGGAPLAGLVIAGHSGAIAEPSPSATVPAPSQARGQQGGAEAPTA